ncbi:transporter [Subtercola sp. Z020]|uniref:copper resistance CopC family protein n=1 Tax=Subtercola sp. Z020 TaxID=2080582 RepID=UPI000CE86467|nr:copper resistance CopC family protein [Subtercola sp. Z020]PPF82199.1 transporter [Subtercola sp. Z020]
MRRVAAAAGVLAVAALLALLPVSSASAHDYLVSSSPAAGATVTAPPAEVSLTFNDLVLDLSGDGSSSIVEVTGPDAATTHFETGCTSILSHTVSAPVALGGPGSYTVSWQIVSSDGHPVSNSLTFEYAPAAGTAASAGSASAPDCGRPGATALGAAPSATTSAGDGLAGWLILAVAGGIVLLAVVAVVVILLVSARRKKVGESSASDQSGSAGTPNS